MFDRHGLTVISLILGALGSMYLSYDLLGRPRGILRRCIGGVTGAVLGALVAAVMAWAVTNSGKHTFSSLDITYTVIVYLTCIIGGFFFAYFAQPKEKTSPLTLAEMPKASLMETRAFIRSAPAIAYLYPVVGMASVFWAAFSQPHRTIGAFFITMGFAILFVGILLLGLLVLAFAVATYTRVILPRIVTWSESLPKRSLGAIGACLTLTAFLIQLTLEIFR